MYNVVEAMKKNWYLNERIYDSIHGEGAYEERFRLTPVYESEYETESDEEEEENSVGDGKY
jgi:hypothetical protein